MKFHMPCVDDGWLGASILQSMNFGMTIDKGKAGGSIVIAGREIDYFGLSQLIGKLYGKASPVDAVGVLIQKHGDHAGLPDIR